MATAAGQADDPIGGTNPAYVRHLLSAGRVVVAELAGTVVGYGAVQQIGAGQDAIAMLCDLFVDPASHGRGLGRAMLADLWAAAGPRMTFSSLHSHAIPLYTSFGLDAWWPLLYLHGPVAALPIMSGLRRSGVAPGVAARYEALWTGADRQADLLAWAAKPGGETILLSRDDEVVAAGAVLNSGPDRGITHLAISPAADEATAIGVVLLALAQLEGPEPGGCVSLPAPHPAVRALLAAGWRFDEFDLFMATEPGLLDPRRSVPSPAQA